MKSTKVEHYLISLPFVEGRHMHCYLMTTNSRHDMAVACDRMLKAAAEFEVEPLPMFVSTGPLDAKYTKVVRGIISEMPEVKESLKTASDFHITVFIPMPEADTRLMAIH